MQIVSVSADAYLANHTVETDHRRSKHNHCDRHKEKPKSNQTEDGRNSESEIWICNLRVISLHSITWFGSIIELERRRPSRIFVFDLISIHRRMNGTLKEPTMNSETKIKISLCTNGTVGIINKLKTQRKQPDEAREDSSTYRFRTNKSKMLGNSARAIQTPLRTSQFGLRIAPCTICGQLFWSSMRARILFRGHRTNHQTMPADNKKASSRRGLWRCLFL